MYKIKTLNAIAKIGLDKFPHDRFSVGSDIENPDAIILRSHVLNHHDIPPSVKIIGRAGAGTNNIPVAELTKRGIPVLNTPGANANAVCEVVIAGLFLASRHLCRAWEYVKQIQGNDESIEQQVESQKKQFAGYEIAGKTLGIIGLGSIGTKVANTAIALGMEVVGYDPAITVTRAWELSSKVKKADTIESLLKQSDFVSIHVPLVDGTKNLITQKELAAAKPNLVLLNFSRDGIVNNDDMLIALNNKKIQGYVTDFPSGKLKDHPATICLPHLGASTNEAEENCACMIVEQVSDFLETGAIINSVNFPSVAAPEEFNHIRLAITNANVPNMVAQISEILGAEKCNIVSLVNKSRNDIAYNLIDIDTNINDKTLASIASISGILQVRMLRPV